MPTTPEEAAPAKRFRWRVIAATWFYFVGGLGLIATTVMVAIMSFVNVKYGWIVPNPEYPMSIDAMAFTSHNVLKLQVLAALSVLSLFAAISWHRGWWRVAWIASMGWYSIGAVAHLTGLGFGSM